MSTTVVVPPPSTSSLHRHLPRLTARARSLLTTLNLHFAGVAAFAVLVLYLALHLVFIYRTLSSDDEDAIAHARAQMIAAQLAARPLHGLDAKVAKSTEDADAFYAARLPYAYSQVAAELGVVTRREGVRLSRVQYAPSPLLSGKDALTEVRMDASISGDYRAVVQFVNALERDRIFFVISGINLSGQQTGQVNLRLRLTTFLRTPNADEMSHETALPAATDAAAAPAGGAQ